MKGSEVKTNRFGEVVPSRIALGAGGLLLGGASGYMNVAGWVAQAPDVTSAWVNAVLATGMEVGAAGGLAWAGYQLGKRRPLRAAFSGAVGGVLIFFNTMAAQNFIHVQFDVRSDVIETARVTTGDDAAKIRQLENEQAAIEQASGGVLPRPVVALDAAVSGLDPNNPSHAARLRRLGTERGLRVEYDRVQKEIDSLRKTSTAARVRSDNKVRTVMPAELVTPFIWSAELIKGSIFFMLGTSDLGAAWRRRASRLPVVDQLPIEQSPPEGGGDKRGTPARDSKGSGQSPEERARWARVKSGARNQKAP